jgi:Rrf2 family protein
MRLAITRATDLALRSLRALASTSRRVKSRELAAVIGSSPGFTTQVLAPLVHAGWVLAAPGPTGGYSLAPRGRAGTLLELIELLEGPVIDGRCVLEDGACPAPTPCELHDAWAKAREALIETLGAAPAVQAPKAGAHAATAPIHSFAVLDVLPGGK